MALFLTSSLWSYEALSWAQTRTWPTLFHTDCHCLSILTGAKWEQTWMASLVKTLKKQIADLNNQYLTKKGVVIGAKFKVTF